MTNLKYEKDHMSKKVKIQIIQKIKHKFKN